MTKCIGCDKEISKYSKRCKSCSNKFRKGKYFLNSENKKGSNHPNWKGGISQNYMRRISLENLKQKCSLCNSKKNLEVHHIDQNRKNNKLLNLIILCRSCHTKIHYKLNPHKGKKR